MGIGTAPKTQNGSAPKEKVSQAKADFFAEFSEDYGYSGRIDDMYAHFVTIARTHFTVACVLCANDWWQQCERLSMCGKLRFREA